LVCVAVVALAACGAGSSAPAPATVRPIPSPSTTLTPAAVSSQVLAAYRDMWFDLVTAAETSDYQSPLLSQHTTGAALTLLTQGLATDQLHGIVTRGATVHHPTVTSLSPAGTPTRATITDCFDDAKWLEYNGSGGLVKNTPGGRRSTTAQLVKTEGTWKVDQLTVAGTGTC